MSKQVQVFSSVWTSAKKGFSGEGDPRGAVGFLSWILMAIAIIWTFINAVIPESSITKTFSYVDLCLFVVFFAMNIYAYRRAENWVPDPEVGAFLQLTTV